MNTKEEPNENHENRENPKGKWQKTSHFITSHADDFIPYQLILYIQRAQVALGFGHLQRGCFVLSCVRLVRQHGRLQLQKHIQEEKINLIDLSI